MSFIMPLLFLIGITGFWLLFCKRRFEQALPAALLSSVLLVYLSGMLGDLRPGLWLGIAAACLFPAGLLLAFLRDKARLRDVLARFFTPGFGLFVLLYVFVFILDYRRDFGWWDEYSHWGPMAKETFRLNAFYCVPESVLTVHPDYPPMVTLFQYIWCKLCGGYDAAFLYRSLHMLCLSLFCPAAAGLKWPDSHCWKKRGSMALLLGLLSAVMIVCCGIIPMECDFFTSIYTDSFLGLLLAYCFAMILLEKNHSAFSLVSLCVALTAMTLTKQIAVYFVCLCVCLFLMQSLWERRKGLLRPFLSAALLAGVPAVFFLSWQYVLKINGVSSGMDTSGIQWAQLPGIFMDQSGNLDQRLIVIHFKAAFFSKALGTHPVDLSYFQALFLFLGVFAGFALYAKRRETGLSPIRLTGFAILAPLGGAGYALTLLLSYLYHFSSYEAILLASYERYAGTYLLALSALAVMLLVRQLARRQEASEKKALGMTLLLLCGLILCTPPAKCISLVPSLKAYPLSREYQADTAALLGQTGEDASILLVAQGDTGLAGYILRYEVLPRRLGFISLGAPKYDGDVWSEDLSPEAFSAELREYEYLYLYKLDDAFSQQYGSLFQGQAAPQEKVLYQIIQTGDSVSLQPK